MKEPRSVIKKPIISEKSYKLLESNKYVFEVATKSNKEEIKDAIQSIFKVKVVKVNTSSKPGKMKRQGWTEGRTAAAKKAIVTLAEGDKIEFFEAK